MAGVLVTRTHRGMPCDDGGRDRSDQAANQGLSRITGRKRQEAKRILPHRLHWDHGPADALNVGIYLPELCDHTFLLFLSHLSVALRYSSLRKLMQLLKPFSYFIRGKHLQGTSVQTRTALGPRQTWGFRRWRVCPGSKVCFPLVSCHVF